MNRRSLTTLLALAVLLASALTAAAARAEQPPFTAEYLTNSSVAFLWNTSKAIYAVTVDGGRARLLALNLTSPAPLPRISARPLAQYAARPQTAAIDSYISPHYIGVVLPTSQVELLKLTDGSVHEYAISGTPVASAFVNTTFLVLSKEAKGNTLYAFSPSKLGWYEARLRVGDLLPTRRENINPLSLVPVHTLTPSGIDVGRKAVMIAESKAVNVTGGATLAGMVFTSGANATLRPLQNATVYVVDLTLGALVGAATTTATGSFTAPAPAGFKQLVLYVQAKRGCYSFTITPNDVIKVRTDYFILRNPLVIRNNTLPTLCPSEQKPYRLFLVEPGRNPLTPTFTPINLNITTTSLNILLVFEQNNTLYIVASVPTKQGLTLQIIPVNEATLNPIPENIRTYYIGAEPVLAEVSADGKLILITLSNGEVLVASRSNGAYQLLWSTSIDSKPTAASIGRTGSPNSNYYSIAVGSANGNLAIVYINPVVGNVHVYTYREGLPYIKTGYHASSFVFRKGDLILATSNRGIAAVAAIASSVHQGYLQSLAPYRLTEAKIRVVDEIGRPLKRFNISYKAFIDINGSRILVLNETRTGSNGIAEIGVIPVLTYNITITPLDRIHVPVERSNITGSTLLAATAFKVDLRILNVELRLVDTYTGGAPQAPLKIRIYNDTLNINLTLTVQKGTSTAVVKLKPGTYRVQVRDLSSLYYHPLEERVTVKPENRTLTISLTRLAAIVRVVLLSKYNPTPNDKLRVELLKPDGEKLAGIEVQAPTRQTPRRVAFATAYRGVALLRIQPLPQNSTAPFYREITVQVNISSLHINKRIELQPMLYAVKISLVDERNKPVNATYYVYVFNTTKVVAKASGLSVEFMLTRGRYDVRAVPDSGKLPFPLYKSVKKTIDIAGNLSIVLRTTKVRVLTNITVFDPYSPTRVLIDDLRVYLDGKPVGILKKGTKPLLRLPLSIKSSNITFKSMHGIYKDYHRSVKPSNKTVKIAIPRKLIKTVVYVVNDVGEPVGGATVSFTGVDTRYATSSISAPDGTAEATLPYGKYRICVTASGYNQACTTALIAKPFKTTIVVTPKPMTIVMRYSSLIAITVFAIVMVVIVRAYFRKVLERFTTEEEF